MSDERAAVTDTCLVPGLQGYLGYPVSVEGVRKALAELNLDVVTDADMRVLEAMGKLPLRCLESVRDGDSALHPMVHPPLLAELARRETKP